MKVSGQTVPEYLVAESVKTLPMGKPLHCTNLNLDQVVVDLVELSKAVSICMDTLGEIQNSLHVLVQSLEVQL